MFKLRKPGIVLSVALLLLHGAAVAQDAASDQADVWAMIEEQWNADEEGNEDWAAEMLADNFSGWAKNAPAPRSKASTTMWDRFAAELGTTVAHELYPLAIIVNGDVAIAHYLYTNAVRDKDGDVEIANGRYTDVLVRTGDGWKFIAWHGGDDD